MIFLYGDDGICHISRTSSLDVFGDHAEHCSHCQSLKYMGVISHIMWHGEDEYLGMKRCLLSSSLTSPEGR